MGFGDVDHGLSLPVMNKTNLPQPMDVEIRIRLQNHRISKNGNPNL